MTRRARQTHGPAVKAKVILAALKGEKTFAELAQHYDVHPNQTTAWKAQLAEEGARRGIRLRSCGEPRGAGGGLHAKIGELTLENDFLSGALNKAGLLSAKR